MNAIGASVLIVLMCLVLVSSRRWALIGMMAGTLYLTHAQVVNVLGFNLFALRFLELAGFIRVLIRRELVFSNLNSIDRSLILLYIYSTCVFLLRSHNDYAYSIGMMVDAFLCYFTFRALIINIDDLRWFLCTFIFVLLPFVVLVTIEMLTHHNPFALIGGLSFTERDGRLRCMGSFRHPSLLGTLGASFLPLYMALFFQLGSRGYACVGVVLCFSVVYLTNSGGPLSAAAIGLVAWLFWGMRAKMTVVRRTMAVSIMILAMVMKAPIWYLPAKLSSFTGGDGWHRSYLMEVAFENLDKWWLSGMDIVNTANWFPYALPSGVADITNQFISYGLQSGLLAIILFISLIVSAFRSIGQNMELIQSVKYSAKPAEYLLWGLGCVLVVHISTWFGITYNSDQTYVIWFMQLAAISAISTSRSREDELNTKNQKFSTRYSIYRKSKSYKVNKLAKVNKNRLGLR